MGCPADCGECGGHRQKAAFFLFEITSACNLKCPICLGAPSDQGPFISLAEMTSMVNSVLEYAGSGQIVTLGGGEPTLHPEFFDLVRLLKKAGMEEIWVYTNGRKIAREPEFAWRLADENIYTVLQWDGFTDATYEFLRGRKLLEEKQTVLVHLKASGVRIGLCPTIVAGVNDQELGRIYDMFLRDPKIGTLDIATMAYVGRGSGFEPGREMRITAQDILLSLEDQTGGKIRATDFSPVSFSHPECLQIAYLLALPDDKDDKYVPLKRFLDPEDYLALIANKPLLELNSDLEDIFHDVVNRLWASGRDDPDTINGLDAMRHMINTLFTGKRPLSAKELKARSMDMIKVVLVHSYMDGLNFDVGRAKMCISRTILPDGRLMPTCAYNVIHRSGPAVPP